VRAIAIGPTGWGSVIRKTTIDPLGDVTINVNSRGGVEVIRKAGPRDYRGWYAADPRDQAPASATWTVTDRGRTAKHEFAAAISNTGAVRVERRRASITEVLAFDVTAAPDYRGETTRRLETSRKAFVLGA
jgi:hypothetical protein